ncbi:hypothetical protein E2C00_07965 [Streptomyces sp. WAC05374]|uniref:hypothetical protein n=1 Tax=Streptomyces sp. WAC05374 TaxID=2487420 RepID=UPI000F88FE9E|nr:hypothetical protein [Streptomyces sp. WAC05374]RST07653.1 hypothetical protein EF905_31100 [Streptomyces sp. WAC05374]TDF45162.1 hypothetical protein E2B92_12625 [Streptomyces sp. WAC05374]TDF55851.1 hypothetical protein E2C02_15075 [Streptomyces sp. WAC05374]TDF58988.1 hypothetical protein E2C00_07965 [Streptomyces sp. WAC05374]
MGDTGLWIAGLTGVTAVLASWVTSLGHTRAARLQAEITAATQEETRRREVRRAAYLAFLEQAHLTGVEYRQTPAILGVEDDQRRRDGIDEHRARLREVFGPFRHTYQVATVHAVSAGTAVACDRVFAASREVYMALGDIADGVRDASAFHVALHGYWTAVDELGRAVRHEDP